MRTGYLFCFLFFAGIIPIYAQTGNVTDLQNNYRIHIKATSEEIEIDGDLTEEVWQTTEKATDFWMTWPVDDQRSEDELQTEVMMAYDDTYIYIAAICKGPGPYLMPSLKRDNQDFWSGDAFGWIIDPVNERTNGFGFGTNPAGVQFEVLISGQTGTKASFNQSAFNVAWDNKWFSNASVYDDHWTVEVAIPFKSLRFGSKKTWGINFMRIDSKTNTSHTWSPVPLQFIEVDLGYTGALVWDKAPEPTKKNISVIPYVLGSYYRDYEEKEPAEWKPNAGLDAKFALTTSLNLDLTVNPDFSQVDVDQQVTNLNTFSIRFPERRLFFLENSDIFSDFGIPPMRPFFSRRIGLDEDGNTIPILFGARLSGNVNKNLRIGAMNMQTGEDEFPGNNYASLAMHQRVFARSVVKGYFHNRQAFVEGESQKDDYNRVGGLEFQYQTADGRWRAFGGYGLSATHDYTSDNYFYSIGTGFNGRNLSFYTNVAGVGDNYIADMGFIPRMDHYDAVNDTTYRIGFHHNFTRLAYSIYPDHNPGINNYSFGYRGVLGMTTDGIMIYNMHNLSYNLLGSNTSMLEITTGYNGLELLYPYGFTDEDKYEPLPAGRYEFVTAGITYKTDARKNLSASAGVEYGGFYNGTRLQISASAKYRVQPWGNFDLNFVQNILKFPEPYGEETLYLIGPRTEINFSRNIFWTTFLQFNTQNENFNINSRLQWRYQPMSDLFIVYTDNYITDGWGPRNRGLVIKLNYWLNL